VEAARPARRADAGADRHEPDRAATRRAKAIDGLTALGDTRAPALFKRIAGQENESINVRFAAVRGLAQMTPRDQAAQALKPILQNANDSRVRALAAEQIAVRSRGKSCDMVRAQLEREKDDVRGRYGRAMKQCGIDK
jgi:HEAT repeat protein